MNAPLRVNEALLIADHAFEPFQCVAWDAPNGTGELSLAVIDRTSTRIGAKQVSSRIYSDPAQWASLIEEVRAELCEKGYDLQPWSMPKQLRPVKQVRASPRTCATSPPRFLQLLLLRHRVAQSRFIPRP